MTVQVVKQVTTTIDIEVGEDPWMVSNDLVDEVDDRQGWPIRKQLIGVRRAD
jgi:hypothetical protein